MHLINTEFLITNNDADADVTVDSFEHLLVLGI